MKKMGRGYSQISYKNVSFRSNFSQEIFLRKRSSPYNNRNCPSTHMTISRLLSTLFSNLLRADYACVLDNEKKPYVFDSVPLSNILNIFIRLSKNVDIKLRREMILLSHVVYNMNSATQSLDFINILQDDITSWDQNHYYKWH